MLIGVIVFLCLILGLALFLIWLYYLKIKQLRKRIRKLRNFNYLNSKTPLNKESFSNSTTKVNDLSKEIWAVVLKDEVLNRFSNRTEAESYLIESKRQGLGQVYIAFDPEFKYSCLIK